MFNLCSALWVLGISSILSDTNSALDSEQHVVLDMQQKKRTQWQFHLIAPSYGFGLDMILQRDVGFNLAVISSCLLEDTHHSVKSIISIDTPAPIQIGGFLEND